MISCPLDSLLSRSKNSISSTKTTLAETSNGPKLGELIALSVANVNGCAYCNAAPGLIGETLVHIKLNELDATRHG